LETVNKLSSAGIYLALLVGLLMMLFGFYFHENIAVPCNPILAWFR